MKVSPAAAARLGLTVAEYSQRSEAGLKWCTACKEWHSLSAFQVDSSRSDGLRAGCRQSRLTPRRTDEDRFNVRRSAPTANGCIEWTGSRYPTGYGSFWFEGRVQPAHRVAWLLAGKPLTKAEYVLHRCDNPPCVNVEHLFTGSHQDNMDDMAAKGRRASQPGALNANARLKASDVEQIVALRGVASSRSVGSRFGISHRAVLNIWNGKAWRECPR